MEHNPSHATSLTSNVTPSSPPFVERDRAPSHFRPQAPQGATYSPESSPIYSPPGSPNHPAGSPRHMLSWDSREGVSQGTEGGEEEGRPANGDSTGAAGVGHLNNDSGGPGLGQGNHYGRKGSISALFTRALSLHPRKSSTVDVLPSSPAIAAQGQGLGSGQGPGPSKVVGQQSITIGTGMDYRPPTPRQQTIPLTLPSDTPSYTLSDTVSHILTHFIKTLLPLPFPVGILHALSIENRGGGTAAASNNNDKRNSRDRDHALLDLSGNGIDINSQHWKTHYQWYATEPYCTLRHPHP